MRQGRVEEWTLSMFDRIHDPGRAIDANNGMSVLGEASCVHQTYAPQSDDGYSQWIRRLRIQFHAIDPIGTFA